MKLFKVNVGAACFGSLVLACWSVYQFCAASNLIRDGQSSLKQSITELNSTLAEAHTFERNLGMTSHRIENDLEELSQLLMTIEDTLVRKKGLDTLEEYREHG